MERFGAADRQARERKFGLWGEKGARQPETKTLTPESDDTRLHHRDGGGKVYQGGGEG
jgi:hypothetical protein